MPRIMRSWCAACFWYKGCHNLAITMNPVSKAWHNELGIPSHISSSRKNHTWTCHQGHTIHFFLEELSHGIRWFWHPRPYHFFLEESSHGIRWSYMSFEFQAISVLPGRIIHELVIQGHTIHFFQEESSHGIRWSHMSFTSKPISVLPGRIIYELVIQGHTTWTHINFSVKLLLLPNGLPMQ